MCDNILTSDRCIDARENPMQVALQWFSHSLECRVGVKFSLRMHFTHLFRFSSSFGKANVDRFSVHDALPKSHPGATQSDMSN